MHGEIEAGAALCGIDFATFTGSNEVGTMVQRAIAENAVKCGGVEPSFGGTKGSGHGREKGLIALDQMSNTKTFVH